MRSASEIDDLAQGLQPLDTDSPDEIWSRVVETLSTCAPEYPAHAFSLARVDGALAMTTRHATGEVARAASRRLAAHPGRYLTHDPMLGTRRPVAPGFTALSSLYEREALRSTPLWREVLAPHGLVDELRLVVHAADRFVAWLGLLRPRGTPSFGHEETQALNRLAGPVSEVLNRADRIRRARCPRQPGDVLMLADGTIDTASTAGRAWLEVPGLAATIRARVAEVDARRGAHCENTSRVVVALPAAEIQIVCMDHETPVRYLVHIQRNRPLELKPIIGLTEQQLRVARAAAEGATNTEIADALGISVNTVKYHLKGVFETLSIRRRRELRDALEG